MPQACMAGSSDACCPEERTFRQNFRKLFREVLATKAEMEDTQSNSSSNNNNNNKNNDVTNNNNSSNDIIIDGVRTELYQVQRESWPKSGRHIMAQFTDTAVSNSRVCVRVHVRVRVCDRVCVCLSVTVAGSCVSSIQRNNRKLCSTKPKGACTHTHMHTHTHEHTTYYAHMQMLTQSITPHMLMFHTLTIRCFVCKLTTLLQKDTQHTRTNTHTTQTHITTHTILDQSLRHFGCGRFCYWYYY